MASSPITPSSTGSTSGQTPLSSPRSSSQIASVRGGSGAATSSYTQSKSATEQQSSPVGSALHGKVSDPLSKEWTAKIQASSIAGETQASPLKSSSRGHSLAQGSAASSYRSPMIQSERRRSQDLSSNARTSFDRASASGPAISIANTSSGLESTPGPSRGIAAAQSAQLTARERWLAASASSAGPSSRPNPAPPGYGSRYGGIELSRSSSAASESLSRRGSNASASPSHPLPIADPLAPRRNVSGVSERERPPPGAVERYRAALDGRSTDAFTSERSSPSPSKSTYTASPARSAQASTSTLSSLSRAGNMAHSPSASLSTAAAAAGQEESSQAHALKSKEREDREKEVNRVRRRRRLLKAQIAKRSSGSGPRAGTSTTGSGSSESRRLSGGTAMSATSTGSGHGRSSSLGTEDEDVVEGELRDLSSGEEDEIDLLTQEGDPVRILNVWKEDTQLKEPLQSSSRGGEPGVRVTPASPASSRSSSRLRHTSPPHSPDDTISPDGDHSLTTVTSGSSVHRSPHDSRLDGGRASVTPSITSSLGDDSFYDAEDGGAPDSPARIRQKLETPHAAEVGSISDWQLPGIDLGGDLDTGDEDSTQDLHRLLRPKVRPPNEAAEGRPEPVNGAIDVQGTASSSTLRQDALASASALLGNHFVEGEIPFSRGQDLSERRQSLTRLSRQPVGDQDAFARAQAIVDSAGWSSGMPSPLDPAERFRVGGLDGMARPQALSSPSTGSSRNTDSDSETNFARSHAQTDDDFSLSAIDASLSQLSSRSTEVSSGLSSPIDSTAPDSVRLFFSSQGHNSVRPPPLTNNSYTSRRSAIVLPPPRPSPTAPLPAPPDATIAGSSSSLSSTPIADSVQLPPAPPASTSRIVQAETLKGRSRSHSLGQAAQGIATNLGQDGNDSRQVPSVPSVAHVAFANSVGTKSPREGNISLGNDGDTLRGRPRGKTIGAVPPQNSAKSNSSTRTRPRSLLSNELLPFSSPELTISTLAESPVEPLRMRSEASDGFGLGAVSAISTSQSSITSSLLGVRGGPSLPTAPSSAQDGRSITTTSGDLRDAALDRERDRERERRGTGANATPSSSNSVANQVSAGNRSRSGSNASLLQQVQHPKSHASFVIAVAGHRNTGKSTVIKKGLRQFGLSKPNVLSEKVTSHSTVCVVDQEQRTIEVLEIDASVLLNGPGKRFAWPKFLPHIDAVILCYDAGQISSFRGMSELLENFAIERLSIVMLACKSEISPKQVDPYYASDMAGVYNVGLAECTVHSEEGKKRMRDCFSYLVKEVAKARTGRLRKVAAAQAAAQQAAEHGPVPMTTRSPSGMADIGHFGRQGEADEAAMAPNSSQASIASSSIRDRNNSGASSTMDSVPSGGSSAVSYPQVTSALVGADASAAVASDVRNISQQHSAVQQSQQSAHWNREPQRERNVRKLSDATTASVDAPSIAGSNSEDDAIVQQSISKAKLGLQSAKAVGGYVTIEELWDKFFFAAVSGNDERFLLMFMVFYRGFARPLDLLMQMRTRFDALANSERSDGVMIRFSLTRLTTTLSEWVQDYPGDLSAPDTYPVLLAFYARLLQHPSTTHIAATLHPHIEAARHAFDPDAVWSKVEDSDKPQSIAADVPPLGQDKVDATPNQHHLGTSGAAFRTNAGTGTESTSDLSTRLNSSNNASTNSLPQTGYLGRTSSGTDGGSVDLLRTRGYLAEIPSMPQSQPGGLIGGSRHRSASDATTSSQEVGNGVGGIGSPNAGSPLGPSTPATPVTPFSPPVPPVLSDKAAQLQKVALRALSNALAELDDEAIASELTRLEWALFTSIRPRDLLRHILVARDVRDPAGPVARSIAHFNYISYWVCSVVLIQGKTKARARMLEKFMNVAAILRRENNYNTLHSVLAGLGNASVHRLKQTRELLNGKQIIKTYQSLARLMGSDRSFAAYRLALENSDGRTIPYLGVHLQDILSMSDGNPSKRASDGMIHWRKFILMDEAVMAIVRCQRYERAGARPNLAVEKLIMEAPVMDEETLWQRSLQVEPRSSSSQPSKIKKLMQGHTA